MADVGYYPITYEHTKAHLRYISLSVGEFRHPRNRLPAAQIEHTKITSAMDKLGFERHPDFQMFGKITKGEAKSCFSEFLEKSKKTDLTVVYLISRATFQD